jgi:PIN domain nuclease of toxin-antitoxin system
MRVLLDTHALLWWVLGEAELSIPARQAIGEPDNEVFVSAASSWEIATKHRIGKLPKAARIAIDVPGIVSAQGFIELPISIRHGQVAGQLPRIHKDPFDRILVAQAVIEDMILISNDAILGAYGVALLW